jgi:hypothetical protein
MKRFVACFKVSKSCLLVAAIFVVVFVFFIDTRSYSQEISPVNLEKLHKMEDSLVASADSMYEAFIPDTRIELSEKFVRQLVRALKIPNSYYYPFDSLGKMINIIYADDTAFKIFNWEITPSNVIKRYYGAIQLPQEKLKLYGLLDYTEEIGKGLEDSILANGKWYGALYYRIMGVEVQGQKVYTCFGLNTSSPISNKKVLDPLVFTDRGIRFGAPIFGVGSHNFPRQRINRFVLEYKKGVQVSMNWDKERNVIVFDKLVSLGNDPARKYTYVPSGQYDGFRWVDDTWIYQQDLIPIQILRDGDAPSDEPK